MDKNTLQVLLVEDNLTDVLLLEEALESGRLSEHTLTHVKRLDEALRHLHEKGFDVALLDLGLPDSHGFETFARLQREHPTIPILILSGLDDEALAVRAVQEGAQDFVVKGNLKNHRMDRTIRYAIERKRAEQKLMASEAGYRRLFETAQDGIFILDADTGQITDANPFLEALLGYTVTEFIGKRLWEIAPFRDKAANQAAFRTLQEKGFIKYEDIPLAAKSGKFVDVEFVSNVYSIGTKRVIQCNIRDITERKQAEIRIRASEASLAVAQQMAHLGSWELDLSNLNDINANALRWSDEFFRILGYEPAEFEPSNDAFFRTVHPDDREMLSRMMAEAVRGGSRYSVDHRIILPNGQERIIHAEAEVVYGALGQPLKIVGLGQDITEQEKIKQQLQTHSHLLNVIGQSVVVTDLAGTVTYWNHFAERLYGWSSAEAQGHSILDLIVTDTTQQQAAKTMERLMQGESWSGEFVVQKRDGTSFPVYVTDTPLLDEAGHVIGIIGLSLDITERKRAEAAVEAKSREIISIWESMTDAFFNLDAQWRFTHINPQGLQLIQKNREELIGVNIWDAFPQSVNTTVAYTEYHRAMREQVPVSFEDFSPRLGKSFEVHAYPSSTGLSVYFRDISERKQAEAQLHFQKALLEAQLEASPDGTLALSDDGTILFHNQRYVQMWEVPPQAVASRDNAQFRQAVLGKVVNPDQVLERVMHLYANKDERSSDEILLRDGRVFDRYSSPILSTYGLYYGRIWCFRDITERKRAEAALRESEQEQRQLARMLEKNSAGLNEAQTLAKMGSWELDLSSNTLYWSDETCRIFGVDRDKFGASYEAFLERIPADDRAVVNKVYTESVANRTPYTIEHKVQLDDGSCKIVHERCHTFYDEQGRPVRSIGTAQDITERKQAEEAQAQLTLELQQQRQRLNDILSSVPGVVWESSAQTGAAVQRMDYVSDYVTTLLGYSVEEWLTIPNFWLSIVHPDDKETALQPAVEKFNKGRNRAESNQFRWLTRDGRYLWVESNSMAIYDEHGNPIGMRGVTIDITERKQAEALLMESQQRLALATESAQIGIWDWDVVADSMVWDKQMFALYGIDAQDFTGAYEVWERGLHPQDRDKSVSDLAAALDGNQEFHTQFRVVWPGGEVHHIEAHALVQRAFDGSPLRMVGVNWDITERKRAEEERDRFFTLSLDMMAIAGLDGYFKRVSPAFSEVLGFTEAEMLATPFLELGHPDDVAATQAAVGRLAQGDPVVGFENRYRTKQGGWKLLEWRSASVPDEGLIYAVARDITHRKESETALLRMRDELEVRVKERTTDLEQANAALLIQIAERERAEAEMRARANQQEAVAELGQRALADIDMDSLLHGATSLVRATLDVEISSFLELMPDDKTIRFRVANGWKTDITGYLVQNYRETQAGYALLNHAPIVFSDLSTETRFKPSKLLLGQGVVSGMTVVMGSDEKPFGILGAHTTRRRRFSQNEIHFLQAIANVLAAALERNRVETEIRELNSQLNETNEKLKVENRERQMALGTLREVSIGLKQAKEEAEQAKETAEIANRAKSEFLSRMSHELRTPLNAILGFGQILDKQELATLSKESVGYILKGGQHLLDLINEILDISRVEAGHIELSIESIALDDLVPEACALMWPLAAEHHIRLNANAAEWGPYHVMADQQRLKQVLINLFSNAIKYNREGGQVEVSCGQKADGWITIAVRDTGPGIAPHDLPKLFTPFERLNASTTGIEGTGLGLVLSQRLIIAMGGTIIVESTLGQGSTFTVELPEAMSPKEHLANTPADTNPFDSLNEAERTYTVLCIEDNPSNLRLIEILFQNRPEITLLVAMQGSIGLDLARQHEPDLILLDVNLPDINGKEVLTRLQQSALTRDIPVIVISADATPNQVERLLAAGAKAYLTKPLDVDRFLRTTDNFLREILTDGTQADNEEESAA